MSENNTLNIDQLKFNALSMWERANVTQMASELKTYSYWEKVQNEKYIDHCANLLFEQIDNLPPEDLKTRAFRETISQLLVDLLATAPFLNENEKRYMTSETMVAATLDFVDRFYIEDHELPTEDLGQALRNFWIGTLLQSCFELKPTCTVPLYNYSMLYPYTDNLLDSLEIPSTEKKQFCGRLTEVLKQKSEAPANPMEERIFQLVRGIYEDVQYNSSDLPLLQESLLAIHRAQMTSISQQRTDLMPYEMDLLGQTFFKGGTSLLADGVIVNPKLNQDQMNFCFAYGAALQLCDDLQDLESDALNSHHTLFSQLKGHYILDPLLLRLEGFLEALRTDLEEWLPEDSLYLSDVIIRNTKLLLMAAVLQHDSHFKRSFVAKADSYLPVRLKFMKKFGKRIKARMDKSNLTKAYAFSV